MRISSVLDSIHGSSVKSDPTRSPLRAFLQRLMPSTQVRSPLRTLVVCILHVLVLLAVGSLPGAHYRPFVPSELTAPLSLLVPTKVRVTANGAAVSGAKVVVLPSEDGGQPAPNGPWPKEADVGANGMALLSLPPGATWIMAEAPGYARASKMRIIAAPSELDFELTPEEVLTVELRDEAGHALAGEVEVHGADPSPIGVRSDREGHIEVHGLGAGPWNVIARAPGYDAVSVRHSGKSVLRIQLYRLARLHVAVATADGKPAADAEVAVSSASLWPPRKTPTDETGHALISGLPLGSYAVRASKGALVSPTELGVVIGRGADVTIGLKLEQGVFVRVRVVEAPADKGAPVRGAIVTLAESGISPFPLEGATGKDGRTALGPIAKGSATVTVVAPEFMPKGALGVPDDGSEVVVALVRGGEVTGRVVDGRGIGIDGATLRVIGSDLEGGPIEDEPASMAFRGAQAERLLPGPASFVPAGELGVMPGPLPAIPGSLGASAFRPAAPKRPGPSSDTSSAWVTARDGSFRLSPVTPGRVYVFARHPEFVEAASDMVVLGPDGKATALVTMLKGGSVEGRVRDARGHAVEGAYVTLGEGKLGRERSTRTATDGSFAFASVPSEISLSAAPPDDPLRIATKTTVHVDDGSRTKVELVLPAARDDVDIDIVDDRGSPVATAQITATSNDPQEPLRATSFSDKVGRAKLRGVRGLDLRVEVRAPHFAPHVATLSGSSASLRVTLAVAEAVTGEVRSYRGDPLAKAELSLSTAAEVYRAVTGPDGTFEIEGLASGPATLRVNAEGFAPLTRAVMVREERGKRKTALGRIDLSPEAVVEGDVFDAHGKPVAGARVAEGHAPTFTVASRSVQGMAISDAKGHFRLGALPEGNITIEAYAPEAGRGRTTIQGLTRGKPTTGARIVLQDTKDGPVTELLGAGSVAVTLGQSGSEVVIVGVLPGSNAERAGVRQDDTLVAVDGVPVHTIEEARKRMTGPTHDDVVLRLKRGGESELPLRVSREALRR
ncbi:MAG: carboxypeptidase regulatory-like domain-containing protein [Polyangiaceae bacterium]